jgi:hypothetical protein
LIWVRWDLRSSPEAIHDDPEVQDFLAQTPKLDSLSRFAGDVEGFDEPFTMWMFRV